jgi:hypothetical protein
LDKNKTISAPIKRISRDVLLERTISAAMGYIKSFSCQMVGTTEPGKLQPDFSFINPAGDVIIWEHLDMMDRPEKA